MLLLPSQSERSTSWVRWYYFPSYSQLLLPFLFSTVVTLLHILWSTVGRGIAALYWCQILFARFCIDHAGQSSSFLGLSSTLYESASDSSYSAYDSDRFLCCCPSPNTQRRSVNLLLPPYQLILLVPPTRDAVAILDPQCWPISHVVKAAR